MRNKYHGSGNLGSIVVGMSFSFLLYVFIFFHIDLWVNDGRFFLGVEKGRGKGRGEGRGKERGERKEERGEGGE